METLVLSPPADSSTCECVHYDAAPLVDEKTRDFYREIENMLRGKESYWRALQK
jgi:hypothetical protein